MIAVALSGGASLILQVAWARILALAIGPTTYAFSAMVATFIAGIALGSLAVGAAVRRRASPRLLAVVLLLGAVAASAAAAWVPRIPLLVADAVAASSSGFETIFRLQVVIIVLLMVPMTMAAGAVLPLAVGLAAQRDDSVPRDVAIVYTSNTLGAIGGALAGGFLLVPILGLHGSVRAAALLGIVASGVVWSAAGGRRRLLVAGLAAAVAAVWLTPSWDRELLSSGAYKYAAYLPPGEREPLLRAGTLHYYREGAVATVSVREVTGTLSLAIDGKIDASNAGDMLTQRLLAHLPLLLHPAPDRVGIIGLGSGVTLGSALRHPISRAEVIEISPEVVEASAFFRRENHDALADPRSRLVVGDGRSHLLLGRAPYDVLISEPSNPWMAGIAALFTREFFDAARSRLRPGGLFCQWAHTYDMSAEDLRSIVATFASAFPETSLWLIGDADVLLVGGAEPLEARLDHVPAAWERPGVRDDLDGVGVTSPAALLSLFVASTRELQAYAAGAAIQRDDRMALEFTGPRQLYRPRGAENVTALRALAESAPVPPVIADARSRVDALIPRGAMLLRAEAFGPAFAAYARAIEHGPLDPVGIDGLLRSAAAAGKASDVEALLRRLRDRRPGDVSIAIALSRLLAGAGKFETAAAVFAAAPPEWRADPRVLEQLASVFADAGDQSLLSASLRDLERIAPDGEAALYYRAVREFSTGRSVEAQRLAERLAGRHGHAFRARAFTLLGAVHATAGRAMEARDAFLAAARADPRDPVPYENLGALALQRGDAEAAIDAFAQALILNPDSAAARQGLAHASAVRHPRM